MASVKEQLNQALSTIATMQREADDRSALIDSLRVQINDAQLEARMLRELMYINNVDHAKIVADKDREIESWKRTAKERGMQLLKLSGRSSLDKTPNGTATATVVAHADVRRATAMETARQEAIRTGKAVAVKS